MTHIDEPYMPQIDEPARVEIGRICQCGGNIKRLQELIRTNPNIVYQYQSRAKWIRMAAWNGNFLVLQIICQLVIVSARSSTRFHHPIIVSARYGNYQCTKFLLESMYAGQEGEYLVDLTIIKLLMIACQDVDPQLVKIILGYSSVLQHLQNCTCNVWDNIDDCEEEITIRYWLQNPPDKELLCQRGENGLEDLNNVWGAQQMFNEKRENFDSVSRLALDEFFEKFNTFIDIPQEYLDEW